MSENYEQMRDRHKKEIEELQANCKHDNVSDWIPYELSPRHIYSAVCICKFCGKIIISRNMTVGQ